MSEELASQIAVLFDGAQPLPLRLEAAQFAAAKLAFLLEGESLPSVLAKFAEDDDKGGNKQRDQPDSDEDGNKDEAANGGDDDDDDDEFEDDDDDEDNFDHAPLFSAIPFRQIDSTLANLAEVDGALDGAFLSVLAPLLTIGGESTKRHWRRVGRTVSQLCASPVLRTQEFALQLLHNVNMGLLGGGLDNQAVARLLLAAPASLTTVRAAVMFLDSLDGSEDMVPFRPLGKRILTAAFEAVKLDPSTGLLMIAELTLACGEHTIDVFCDIFATEVLPRTCDLMNMVVGPAPVVKELHMCIRWGVFILESFCSQAPSVVRRHAHAFLEQYIPTALSCTASLGVDALSQFVWDITQDNFNPDDQLVSHLTRALHGGGECLGKKMLLFVAQQTMPSLAGGMAPDASPDAVAKAMSAILALVFVAGGCKAQLVEGPYLDELVLNGLVPMVKSPSKHVSACALFGLGMLASCMNLDQIEVVSPFRDKYFDTIMVIAVNCLQDSDVAIRLTAAFLVGHMTEDHEPLQGKFIPYLQPLLSHLGAIVRDSSYVVAQTMAMSTIGKLIGAVVKPMGEFYDDVKELCELVLTNAREDSFIHLRMASLDTLEELFAQVKRPSTETDVLAILELLQMHDEPLMLENENIARMVVEFWGVAADILGGDFSPFLGRTMPVLNKFMGRQPNLIKIGRNLGTLPPFYVFNVDGRHDTRYMFDTRPLETRNQALLSCNLIAQATNAAFGPFANECVSYCKRGMITFSMVPDNVNIQAIDLCRDLFVTCADILIRPAHLSLDDQQQLFQDFFLQLCNTDISDSTEFSSAHVNIVRLIESLHEHPRGTAILKPMLPVLTAFAASAFEIFCAAREETDEGIEEADGGDAIFMDDWNTALLTAASLPGSVFKVFQRLPPGSALAEVKEFYFDNAEWFDTMWGSRGIPIVHAAVMLHICELVEFLGPALTSEDIAGKIVAVVGASLLSASHRVYHNAMFTAGLMASSGSPVLAQSANTFIDHLAQCVTDVAFSQRCPPLTMDNAKAALLRIFTSPAAVVADDIWIPNFLHLLPLQIDIPEIVFVYNKLLALLHTSNAVLSQDANLSVLLRNLAQQKHLLPGELITAYLNRLAHEDYAQFRSSSPTVVATLAALRVD